MCNCCANKCAHNENFVDITEWMKFWCTFGRKSVPKLIFRQPKLQNMEFLPGHKAGLTPAGYLAGVACWGAE